MFEFLECRLVTTRQTICGRRRLMPSFERIKLGAAAPARADPRREARRSAMNVPTMEPKENVSRVSPERRTTVRSGFAQLLSLRPVERFGQSFAIRCFMMRTDWRISFMLMRCRVHLSSLHRSVGALEELAWPRLRDHFRRLDVSILRERPVAKPFRGARYQLETIMPERKTVQKAKRAKRAGKSPTTQAGEFVHEEIRKVRRGQHGARSPQQAIAIGLSKARRAGVPLRPPAKGKAKARTRKSAEYAYEAGQGKRKTRRQPRVSRAVSQTLKREPRSTASRAALSKQARSAASRRSAAARSAAARKAAKTKGPAQRSAAAKKAARTRARRRR
ncbi:hypothetical protein [Bradyrhizobium sp. 157]|uniref:hypothetical protein n=1 Tax=Bradyrhizobium sp. 157 TaxID=2782631 RepID=UPI001FFBF47A|nr:hypothetical protein [Bradyrhizobium sp. 157]